MLADEGGDAAGSVAVALRPDQGQAGIRSEADGLVTAVLDLQKKLLPGIVGEQANLPGPSLGLGAAGVDGVLQGVGQHHSQGRIYFLRASSSENRDAHKNELPSERSRSCHT